MDDEEKREPEFVAPEPDSEAAEVAGTPETPDEHPRRRAERLAAERAAEMTTFPPDVLPSGSRVVDGLVVANNQPQFPR